MRTKILLLFIASTLTLLFIQALFFQRSASSVVYELESRSSLNSLKNMQNELYNLIKSYENNLIKIYSEDDFIQDLSSPLPSQDLKKKYDSFAYSLALSIFEPRQNIGALYLYDTSDALISSYRSANTPRYNYPEDIYDSPEQSNAAAVANYLRSDNRAMLISSYFNTSSNRELIRFVLNIYSVNNLEKIGYIVCDVNTGSFTQIIKKYTYSSSQFVWLQPVGDRPLLQFGVMSERITPFFNYMSEEIRNSNLQREESSVYQGNVFMTLALDKYNLVSFSLTPQYLLEQSQIMLRKNLIFIVLLVTVSGMISIYLLSRYLTTPLKKIVDNLENIKNGDTRIRLQVGQMDEIGLLAQTINQMLDRIQDLAIQEYNLEMLLKQAEYKTLQAQVNPHFLYNSLDTMSGIAISQNCKQVSILCNALSNIFRYSIDMKDTLSTVDREILHIKNYMHVINTRMMNGIKMKIDLLPEILNIQIPRLTLQPIVENAVNHGLKNKRGPKEILIKGAISGEDVLLSISDNGVGMNAEKIQKKLSGNPEETLGLKSSIGLSNIHSRIRMLFGESYGITLHSEENNGSTVLLKIPMNSEEVSIL